jgi:hypothetical protein
MLSRFLAAASVGSVVIAFASLILLLIPLPTRPSGAYLLTTVWCLVPVVWGIWAMMAPPAWPLERLPIWGAILGLIAGTIAAFVLDIPARVVDVNPTVLQRMLVLPVAMVLYYVLWMVVRKLCQNLSRGMS